MGDLNPTIRISTLNANCTKYSSQKEEIVRTNNKVKPNYVVVIRNTLYMKIKLKRELDKFTNICADFNSLSQQFLKQTDQRVKD